MSLPVHVRAFALIAAVATSSAVITVVSDIGHPPPPGKNSVARALRPADALRQNSVNTIAQTDPTVSRLVVGETSK